MKEAREGGYGGGVDEITKNNTNINSFLGLIPAKQVHLTGPQVPIRHKCKIKFIDHLKLIKATKCNLQRVVYHVNIPYH